MRSLRPFSFSLIPPNPLLCGGPPEPIVARQREASRPGLPRRSPAKWMNIRPDCAPLHQPPPRSRVAETRRMPSIGRTPSPTYVELRVGPAKLPVGRQWYRAHTRASKVLLETFILVPRKPETALPAVRGAWEKPVSTGPQAARAIARGPNPAPIGAGHLDHPSTGKTKVPETVPEHHAPKRATVMAGIRCLLGPRGRKAERQLPPAPPSKFLSRPCTPPAPRDVGR